MEIKRSRSKALMVVVILFVVAVLIAAGTLGYFWYRKSQQPQESSSTNGGSISLDATEKVETERIEAGLVIPRATDKPGDTIRLSVLGMTVPTSWRTVNAKGLLNTPLETVYATSSNDILAQLVMVPDKRPTDKTQVANSLGLYNITSWLAKPTPGVGGTVTPAAKTAYIQNIAAMGEGKPADPKACEKSFGVLNPGPCGDLLKAKVLSTADSKLKGVAFFNTSAQSVGYDPQVMVFLTGRVKDQQIFAYGTFHLLDNNSHQLSATDTEGIKAAWEDFKAGNVPSDTMALYQHVIDAIKSISIQAN